VKVKDGRLYVPTGPGLGLNMDVLKRLHPSGTHEIAMQARVRRWNA
jgi:D-galactarolactone cycloisomerase